MICESRVKPLTSNLGNLASEVSGSRPNSRVAERKDSSTRMEGEEVVESSLTDMCCLSHFLLGLRPRPWVALYRVAEQCVMLECGVLC